MESVYSWKEKRKEQRECGPHKRFRAIEVTGKKKSNSKKKERTKTEEQEQEENERGEGLRIRQS